MESWKTKSIKGTLKETLIRAQKKAPGKGFKQTQKTALKQKKAQCFYDYTVKPLKIGKSCFKSSKNTLSLQDKSGIRPRGKVNKKSARNSKKT